MNSKNSLSRLIEKHKWLFIDLLNKPYEYEETNILMTLGMV
jgi:hypothetical protein